MRDSIVEGPVAVDKGLSDNVHGLVRMALRDTTPAARPTAAALLTAGFAWAWLESAHDPRAMLARFDALREEMARHVGQVGSVH